MRPGTKGVPRLLDVSRQPGQPKKRRKVTLLFDEEKRRDFLSGFHKRKLQRRQKAQDELKVKLKEEKKRIKQEARERFKTLVSQRDIPELEELLSKEEYEADGKTVSILELNVNDLAQSCNWIGENKPSYEGESDHEDEEAEGNASGEELIDKKSKKPDDKNKAPLSKKLATKAAQKEILKQTSRSKVFKLKQRLDRQKNKKLSQKVKFQQERAVKKAKGKAKRKLLKKKA